MIAGARACACVVTCASNSSLLERPQILPVCAAVRRVRWCRTAVGFGAGSSGTSSCCAARARGRRRELRRGAWLRWVWASDDVGPEPRARRKKNTRCFGLQRREQTPQTTTLSEQEVAEESNRISNTPHTGKPPQFDGPSPLPAMPSAPPTFRRTPASCAAPTSSNSY